MFCKSCGSEIPDNAKFCTKCGMMVNNDKEINEPINRKSNSKMYALIASITLVIAVIAGVAGYMVMNKMKPAQNSEVNSVSSNASNKKENSSNNKPTNNTGISDEEKIARNKVKDKRNNNENLVYNQSEHHTYKVIKMNATWDEAEDYCEEQGGHLATITNKEESDKVKALINETDAKVVWLGANDLNYDDCYEWITGEEMNYSEWAQGEPNNDQGIEHYLVVYKVNGEWVWNDGPVDTNKAYDPSYTAFVCEWDE